MRVELVSVTHAMLHEVMHANKAIFGLWASSLFRCNSIEQLSAASPLQPSFVCPCVVSLSALLSDSMLQKMTTWLPSTNHCAIAMLLWFRCVVSQQSWHWHWFFPTKISLFRHWLDGVYFTTNSYFLDCLILYEKVPSNTYTTFTLQYKSKNNFDTSALLWHINTILTYQHYFDIYVLLWHLG